MLIFKKGFTLVELLVTTAIIGIMASMALANFSEFTVKAYDMRSVSAVKNGMLSQEAYFVNTQTYATCLNNEHCKEILPGFAANEDIFFESYGQTISSNFSVAPDGSTITGGGGLFAEYIVNSCAPKGSKNTQFKTTFHSQHADCTACHISVFEEGTGGIIAKKQDLGFKFKCYDDY